MYKSSCPEEFCKKDMVRNLDKFPGKGLSWSFSKRYSQGVTVLLSSVQKCIEIAGLILTFSNVYGSS